MSDFAASSSFSPVSEFSPAPEFDVSSLEANVRTINAVEQRWRLPTLPDEIKLDLATMDGIGPQGLQEFLLGLDSDLNDEPEQPDPLEGLDLSFEQPRSAMDQFRVIGNDIVGNPVPPTELTRDAVKRFKVDAIERGLLDAPPDGQLDSRWSPELNRVRQDMLYDDIDSFYAGDRNGAASTNKILKTIGDWTQPTGLLAAATELDLFWDFGAIDREFSSWGDKWRKVAESGGPLDFAKNLVDAVTGPIDDLVFPALNLALLATGVGALANGARVGFMGARAASQGGALMRTLYGASRLAAPSSLAAIAEPSWMAGRLAARGGLFGALGGQMVAWRQIPVVGRVKQGVQLGMRAGFMSQAEDLMPGYQGGVSLAGEHAGVASAAEGFSEWGFESPLATIPELMLAPYNIFNPGTFMGQSGLLSSAGKGFLAAGGTIPGRAAIGAVGGAVAGTILGDDTDDMLEGMGYGALSLGLLPQAAKAMGKVPGFARGGLFGAGVGAGVAAVTDLDIEDGVMFGAITGTSLVAANSAFAGIPNPGKWVGNASDVLARLDYSPIAQDQKIGMVFQRGIRSALADTPEAAQRWDETMARTNSFRDTLADFLGTDVHGADAAVTYVMVAAAIDHTASIQAGGKMGDAYHLYRNKLIAQLKTFDLDSQFLAEDLARALAIDKAGGTNYTRHYDKMLDTLNRHPESVRELAEQHNRVAEQTLHQLVSLENLPDLAPQVRVGPWQELDAEARLGTLESYIGNVMPTFGNWPQFSKQALSIEDWVNNGFLDGATFAKVKTPWDTFRSPRAEIFRVKESIRQASDEITDTLIRDPRARAKAGTHMAPLARLQPSGRFAMARHDTITKQNLESLAFELQDSIEAAEKLRNLFDTGTWKRLNEQLEAAGRGLTEIDHDDLKLFIQANGFGSRDKQIRYVHSYLKRHPGFEPSMLDDHINTLAADAERWSGYGLTSIPRNAEGQPLSGLEALKARRKEVLHKARYTAAEIDTAETVAAIRASMGDEAADEFAMQLKLMDADGYKLVHGVEFMMPHDLAVSSPLFRDHGVRELNGQTFGNFFSRRQPAVARAAQERRERAAMVSALADIGHDYAPDAPEITQAYRDLRRILLELQDPVLAKTEERHLMNFWEKGRHALDSAFTPLRVDDLTRKLPFVRDRLLKMGWDETQADAIVGSIRHFRNTEFADLGLYALEAKVRSANLNVTALKWMSQTGFGEGLMSPTRLGAAAGAYAGQDAMVGRLDPDASETEVRGAQVAGLLGGGLVGGLLGKGGAKLANRNDWAQDAMRRAEQRGAWMLGDTYARLRDGLRFSLSPIFDLSRYTEGLMLGRTGTPLRHADGSRVLLPSNLSPTATKKRIGDSVFTGFRREFRDISRHAGHGDVDVLDDAGHWFAQIGIMGFNPAEWQVSAFAELRRAGFSADDAYDAARATHTYGTKGRSAAELSANFIMFPFSFQKKALTHAAKWMNDDLGRSILIHDAFRAYEAVNEKYNLDEWFQDHIPALEQMQRLNMLAYGASPGRFGGINSQLFESAGKWLLMFSPIAVNVKGEEDYVELQRLSRSLVPVWNDINWMIKEAKDSKNLVTNGQLARGQVTDGYAEWNEYRTEVSSWLDSQGFSWYDLHNKPYLADQKLAYNTKLAEISQKYPAWVESRRNNLFNVQALEMERNDMLRLAEVDPDNAPAQALMLYEYESLLARVKQHLGYLGVSVDGSDGWLDAPPWVAEEILGVAVSMAEQDPRFIGVWKKFYERELGPIEAAL